MKAIKDKPATPAPAKRAKRTTAQPFVSISASVAERFNASAVLTVGMTADAWDDADEFIGQVVITEPFDNYRVASETGPYRDDQGPFDIRPGYLAMKKGGEQFFYPARALSPAGKKYGHLKLVKGNP